MVIFQNFCWEVAEAEKGSVVGNTALPLTSKLHCDPSSSHAFASLTHASALGLTLSLLPTSASHSSVQSRSVVQQNQSRQPIPSCSPSIQLAFLRVWCLNQEAQRHPSSLCDCTSCLRTDSMAIGGLLVVFAPRSRLEENMGPVGLHPPRLAEKDQQRSVACLPVTHCLLSRR
jgi:hypothetical protein